MARNVATRKLKLSKVAIVMFLTILIWVYADLAVDDTLSVTNVPISIARSGDAELWATFKNEDGPPLASVAIEQIVLKGPSSRIAEIKRGLNNNVLKLAFSLNPEMENMTTAGSKTLDVLDFVRKREQIRALGGVTVEFCEPNTFTVDVVKLLMRELDIQSVDENGRPLEFESITPSEISMYVPEDWGQDQKAEVVLTIREIDLARSKPISKKPYVVLEDNQLRQSAKSVEVKLLPEEDKLEPQTITRVGVAYAFSANTQGKYKVQMEQEDDTELRREISEIKISATPEAFAAYMAQPFQVTLEIEDNDPIGTEITKSLKYNLPEEYVKKGEIKLDPEHETVEAKFKLVPLSSAEK
jgi:hypothetical protein